MQIPNLNHSLQIYEEAKFWGPVLGTIWAVFKIVNWIKELKTTDLAHITEGISNFNTKLDLGLEKQTAAVVQSMAINTNETKELRDDIKMLTSAILNQTAKKAYARRKKKA